MRAVLVDDDGADVLKTQYSYSTGSAGRLYTSKVIESLYYLFANVTGMMYEKGLEPGDVRAMSFASIGQTTILLDKDRKPVPIDRQGPAEVPNLFCRPRKFRERDGSCEDFSYLTGLGSKHIVLYPGKEEYLNAMVFGVMCSLRYLSEGIDSGAGLVFMTGKPISRSPYLRDIAARLFPFEIYYDNDGFQSARGAAALASGIGIDRRKYPKIVPIHCPKTQKYYRRWRSVCP
jgi:sugar (pentulose or hexulose) kinase